MSRVVRGVMGLCLVMAAVGCRREAAPLAPPTRVVDGHVRIGQAPVVEGWIEFIPLDGTRGSLRSAPVGANGDFRASRVPIGAVAIRVVSPRPLRTGSGALDARLEALGRAYAIHREIEAESSGPLDIDLLAEARLLH